ncbi:MAG: undecaprenyldiphospho-muramoylpentapeptide beta-N-acetylglucosaminyltransferase [Acidobacteria bacterium]|nr:undecaprenyldiphospho-muramoylpentapeptide beta-N-acetylglucosaminyltransferase [Acidobacteriota bacterium]
MGQTGQWDARMSKMVDLSVVIAGGGTGGHVFPGIAVGRELLRQRPEASVIFVGTSRGLEAKAVPRAGFKVEFIRSSGLKGRTWLETAYAAMLLPLSAWDAWRVVSRCKPDLVVGVGGYSSGPLVLVAALRGVPTMLLEQNAVPGLTNRLLAPFVRSAAVSFESTLIFFGRKGFVSGNPVRPEFLDPMVQSDTPSDSCRLLVVGGSQGAQKINEAMMSAAPALAAIRPRLIITHQAGPRDVDPVQEAYDTAGIEARVASFLEPIAPEMHASEIVLCRAGATTLAELAAVGRASILVPLATATDDHQRRNAEVIADAGGAEVLLQDDLRTTVAQRVGALVADPSRRTLMAKAMQGFARPDAARVIIERALRLVVS